MHIQLFISEHAVDGNRLRTVLQETLPEVPVIQYHSTEAVGRVMPTAYDDQVIAVIMVSGAEELAMLTQKKNIWDRIKTILVLPDSDPETVSLGHTLRPRFVTFTSSDFSDIVAVLSHIRDSSDGDIHN